MMEGTNLKCFLCVLIVFIQSYQCDEMIVSQSGIVFSQDNNIILSAPDSDKMIIHLALEMPKVKIDNSVKCEDEINESRVNELTKFSVFAQKWFINLWDANLNTVMSIDSLNLFITNGSAHIPRSRRSFDYVKDGYFLLSTWSEDKFAQSYHYTDDMFAKLESSLDQMKIRISKTNQSLRNLSKFMCHENRKINLGARLSDIKLAYLDYVKTLVSEITMAQIGNIPSSVPYKVLRDLCIKSIRQNPKSHICDTINLRTFFETSFSQLLMDKNRNALILEIELTIPRTPTEPYTSYRVYKIPSFDNNTIFQVQSQAQAVAISLKSQKMLAVNNCYKVNKLQICNNPLGVFESLCLNKIYTGNSTNLNLFCDIKVLSTRATCFVHRIKKGLLVSTKHSMPIHEIKKHHSLFSTAGKSEKRIFILPNRPSSRMAIRCDNEDFSTRVVESYTELNITIHRHDVYGIVDDQINMDIQNIIADLSVNMSDQTENHNRLSNKFDDDFYVVKKHFTLMQYILLGCVIVMTTIVSSKCYRFGKLMYEKYQKYTSHRNIINIESTETAETTEPTDITA